jgi:hypothetical protein
MGLISPTLPTAGSPRGSEEVDTINALQAIVTELNGLLDAANIEDGSITAVELATAVKPATLLGQWRTIDTQGSGIGGNETVGLKLISDSSSFVLPAGTSLPNGHARFLMFDPADHAVSGLTTKLRIRAGIGVNNTAPGATFTIGLYPVTFAGADANLVPTLGTIVSGSGAALTTPAANAEVMAVSSEFDVPAAGLYMFAVDITGGTVAAACEAALRAVLQVRHV